MEDVEAGVQVREVTGESPAQIAGLQPQDVITKMDQYPTPNMSAFRELLAEHFEPGDRVELTILREEKEMVLALELADREKFTKDTQQTNEQDRMGSKLSRRRSNFPLAIQHDSNMNANQMGSPVVDLDGNIIGINISRSGRVSTYALPLSIVLPALVELRTGRLIPVLANQARIAEISRTLKSLDSQLKPLGEKLSETEAKLASEQARREELDRLNADIDKRLADITSSTAELEIASKELRQEFEDLKSQVENLENEKKLLETGAR
jgi:serine protease Do